MKQTHNKPKIVVFHSEIYPKCIQPKRSLPWMCICTALENTSVKMSSVYFIHFKHSQPLLLWTSLPTVRLKLKKPLHESGIPDSEEAEQTAFHGPFFTSERWNNRVQRKDNMTELSGSPLISLSHTDQGVHDSPPSTSLFTSEVGYLESDKPCRDLDSLVSEVTLSIVSRRAWESSNL